MSRLDLTATKMVKFAAASVLGLGVMAAAPASAEWRGSAVLTSNTAACVAGGSYTRGAIVNARYRPPNLLGNGNETRLAFHDRYNAFALRKAGNLTSAFSLVQGFGLGSTGGIWNPAPTARMVTRFPAVVTATTPFIFMVIQVTNFDYTAGCTVTMNVVLNLRP